MEFAICQTLFTLTTPQTHVRLTYHLWLRDVTPVNERLDRIGNRRLVEVLGIECRDSADIAVIQFIEAASLDNRDGHIGVFRQPFGDSQTSGASANDLSRQ